MGRRGISRDQAGVHQSRREAHRLVLRFRARHGDRRASCGPPSSRSHRGGSAPLRVSLSALPQAVLCLVGRSVGAVRGADRRHRQLSSERRPDLALLASGRYRVDRARLALRGARFFAGRSLASVVPRHRSVPAGLVLHRHLSPRPVSLGRRTRGALSEPRDPGHRVGLLSLSPARGIERRHAAGGLVRALGTASPRLSLPESAGCVVALGILPRHPVHHGHRRGHHAAGARRSPSRTERAVRALG